MDKNCKVFLLVTTVVIVIVMMVWVPIVWGDQIRVDKPRFATIYYTTLVGTVLDVAKILFGFWLANIFLQRFRFGQVRNLWREALCSLKETCEALERLDLDSDAYREQQDKLKNIYGKLCRLRAQMDTITSLITKEPFINVSIKAQADEYMKDVLGRINELCQYFESSEISMGKPLTPDQRKLIKGIYDRAEKWIVEIDLREKKTRGRAE